MSQRVRLLLLVAVPAVALILALTCGRNILRLIRGQPASSSTIAQRLQQYGPAARQRLAPHFQAAGLTYPPQEIVLLGIKDEAALELYARSSKDNAAPWRLVRRYPVLAASGNLGPKLREGDRQVPEGLYQVELLNPNSRFHLSLRVNYPNDFDRRMAQADGRTNLGGDIMIHGSNVSIGCLAMGDEAAEELFVLAADVGLPNISIILTPVDFRLRDLPPGPSDKLPPWTDELYRQLRARLAELRRT